MKKYFNKNIYIWALMLIWVLNLIASYYFTGFTAEIYDFNKTVGILLKIFFAMFLPLTVINLLIFLNAIRNAIHLKLNKKKVPLSITIMLICYLAIVLIPLAIFKLAGLWSVIYVVSMLYANLFFGVPLF